MSKNEELVTDEHLGYLEDEPLLLISKGIVSDWEQLAIGLGFTWNEVKQIRYDHRRLSDCTMEMLTEWRERQNGTNQVEIMDRALKEQGLTELANNVSTQMSSVKTDEEHGHLADIDMLFIAKRLDNDWKTVGIYLGLKHSELNRIELDFSPPTVDATLEMLVKWRERQEAHVNHLVKMCDALNQLERGDIIEELQTYYQDKYQ